MSLYLSRTHKNGHLMSRTGRLAVFLLIIAAVGGGWFAYDKGMLPFVASKSQTEGDAAKRTGNPALPVIAEYASIMEEKTVVEAVGTGRSTLGVSIYPAVSGEVSDVLFHAGETVSRGQVLLILDSDRERLARDLASVQVKDASQLLDRYEQARPLGAVSASEVDAARTALAEARIRLRRAISKNVMPNCRLNVRRTVDGSKPNLTMSASLQRREGSSSTNDSRRSSRALGDSGASRGRHRLHAR
mgnify:CR=1 FL=1